MLRLTAFALVAYVALDWRWPFWNAGQGARDMLTLLLGVILAPVGVMLWADLLRRRVETRLTPSGG